MDVKTAFFKWDLDEEIYKLQLEDCITPGKEHKVCKLNINSGMRNLIMLC